MKKLIIAILLISASAQAQSISPRHLSLEAKRSYTVPTEGATGAGLAIQDTTYSEPALIDQFRRLLFTFYVWNADKLDADDTCITKNTIIPVIQTSWDKNNWLSIYAAGTGCDSFVVSSADGDTIRVESMTGVNLRADSTLVGAAAYPGRLGPYLRVAYITRDTLQNDHTALNGLSFTRGITAFIRNGAQ